LGGNELPPDVHLFVCFGEAFEWEQRIEKMENSPVQTFKRLVKELNPRQESGFEINVTAVPESSELDEPGDVLIMPYRIRVKNGDLRAKEIIEALVAMKPLPNVEKIDSEGGHIFICVHNKRDARCGYCGPKILASLKTQAMKRKAKVAIRACSHMGGHRYAGNGIIYKKNSEATCDWLGYVSNSTEDANHLLDLAEGKVDTPNVKIWRGRLGMSEAEHKEFCLACAKDGETHDVEDLGKKPVVRKKRRPSVVFVLGGPGSGKGTQCTRIEEMFDFEHLSAGDLLRSERQNPNSKNGQLIDQYIQEGKIVPVEITVQLLLNAMGKSNRSNFLIDGFPRNANNWDGWKRVVGAKARVRGCLYFDCPENVMEKRLLERGKTSGRSDDNLYSIRKRFRTYMDSTRPIIEIFAAQNRCFRIDANRSVYDVFSDVKLVLQSKMDFQPLKRNVLFVLGGPGAGKGTNCQYLTENYDVCHLSAGGLLRSERQNPNSKNGQLIDQYIKEGKIVPVEITVSLLLRAMMSSSRGNFLIDGFPRNDNNYEGWQNVVGDKANVFGCLFFDCPEAVMEQRLLDRGKTSARADDNIESIKKRFRTYKNDTLPIVQRFDKAGNCFRFDTDRPLPEIQRDLDTLFKDRLGIRPFSTNMQAKPSLPKLVPLSTKLALGAAAAGIFAFISFRILRNSDNNNK